MCDKHKFVQIHCHTSASLLDGVNIPEKLAKKAKEFSQPALAITDHGNPANLFAHYKACKKNGIKPILGLEFYINNDLRSRIANRDRDLEEKDYHQSTYIKNKEGYRNFCELTYKSFTDGYYYKPRIDFDLLFEKKEGLMITSSCMASKTSQYIRSNRHKEAEEVFKKLLYEFGEDFYGEIQFNEVEGQKEINDYIIHLCKKYDVPLLIGGDVHYLNPEDNVLQDAIIRSKRSATSKDDGNEKDWVINARHLYFHDASQYFEFNKNFGFNYDTKLIEQCFENSIKFSEKPNFEFETGTYHLPTIKTEGMSSDEYLDKLTWEGIAKIIETRRELGEEFSNKQIEEYEKRLTYELEVIKKMGISAYLLIVQDIINWEKRNGFYVGVGRGSCAGSAVCYAIGITGIDPVQRGLIFERFINPERIVFPDIDWDSEQGARDHILQYLIDTYGQESVCNVATFGLYGPKSALQDMSRGLNKDTKQDSVLMRKISKIDGLDKTDDLVSFFEKIIATTSDQEVYNWIIENRDTIDFAQKLKGQMRQLGVHAGGILVTPGPVYNYIPVTRGSGNLISAFQEADGSGKDLSELGLMKLDVLGLKTLNVLKECVENIKKDTGEDLSNKIDNLRLGDKDDPKIIEFFSKGNNYGIFQMDRSKMFTSRMKVDSFDDIVAINAMNRPGPIDKFLDKYGYWKQIDKGEIEISDEELKKVNQERYPFSFMEKVLSKTYGCLLYQEQFMFLVKEAAGMNYGEGDNFRRGIAWLPDNPKYHTISKYFDQLEKGMLEKGYSKEDTDKFVAYCRDFMGYSFNLAHAECYAYIAYQTLYFKVYYPAYFFAAMINNEDNTDKFQEIIADARKCGVKILPHSIVKSKYETSVEDGRDIRLGYKMIKGMGEAVQDEIKSFKLHECQTLDEVLQKPFKKINSTMLQNLIDLGCFDDFEIERAKIETLKDLYQDAKILNWFTRTKQRLRLETLPTSLKENFETNLCLKTAIKVQDEEAPHIALINALIPNMKTRKVSEEAIKKKTGKTQQELIGFSLVKDDLVSKYEAAFSLKGILPLRDYDINPTAQFYFGLVKKEIKLTKNGKQYLQLTVNDGVTDYKVKCWRVLEMEEGEVYYGKFKKDQYGLTVDDRTVFSI